MFTYPLPIFSKPVERPEIKEISLFSSVIVLWQLRKLLCYGRGLQKNGVFSNGSEQIVIDKRKKIYCLIFLIFNPNLLYSVFSIYLIVRWGEGIF